MGTKGRGGRQQAGARRYAARCRVVWLFIGFVLVVLSVTVVDAAGAHAREAPAVARIAAAKPDGLCDSRRTFYDANERTVGNTTYLNRQLSVYEVLCTDFGKASEALPKGDVFCTLLAAAIGVEFKKDELYADGACASKAIVTHEDPAGIACGGLITLVGAVTDLAPELKAYAVAAQVACATGHSLGSWIETHAEAQAAKAVWRRGQNALKPGRCLKFVTHGFPLGDDWLATPCSRDDRGFADLPEACKIPGGAEGGADLPYSVVGIGCSAAKPVVKDVVYYGGPCNGKNLDGAGCRAALGFLCRIPRPQNPGYADPGDRAICVNRAKRIDVVLPG
jgi:hypothetical protein